MKCVTLDRSRVRICTSSTHSVGRFFLDPVRVFLIDSTFIRMGNYPEKIRTVVFNLAFAHSTSTADEHILE